MAGKKVATPPKNIRNSQYKEQLKTYTKELSKFNGNTTIPNPNQEELWTPKNEDEEHIKGCKQQYNQKPSSKKFEESQDGSSSKGQGYVQILEASKNRLTDRHTYYHIQYEDSQRTRIIFDEEIAMPPIFYICKIFWIPIPIELETLHLSHDFVTYH